MRELSTALSSTPDRGCNLSFFKYSGFFFYNEQGLVCWQSIITMYINNIFYGKIQTCWGSVTIKISKPDFTEKPSRCAVVKKFRDDFSCVKMSCYSKSLVSLLFVSNGCELNCSKISESSWPLFPDACPGEPDIFGQNRFWKQGHVGTIFLYLLVWFLISEYSVYSASINFQPGSVDRNGLFSTNIRHHPRLEKGNIFLKWAIFLCHSD